MIEEPGSPSNNYDCITRLLSSRHLSALLSAGPAFYHLQPFSCLPAAVVNIVSIHENAVRKLYCTFLLSLFCGEKKSARHSHIQTTHSHHPHTHSKLLFQRNQENKREKVGNGDERLRGKKTEVSKLLRVDPVKTVQTRIEHTPEVPGLLLCIDSEEEMNASHKNVWRL